VERLITSSAIWFNVSNQISHLNYRQYSMLCSICKKAFREDSESNQPEQATQTAFLSPFYRASHHRLPYLKQSADDGCPLCFFLWSAAPSEVHDLLDDILSNEDLSQWLPCYFTIDRAIFRRRQRPRRPLIEYKYQTILTDPRDYVQPLKRHFRLLWSEGIISHLLLSDMLLFGISCDKSFPTMLAQLTFLFSLSLSISYPTQLSSYN
jgi:hypothetical protein